MKLFVVTKLELFYQEKRIGIAFFNAVFQGGYLFDEFVLRERKKRSIRKPL